ncbi:hypothetical protein BDQ17DRAFT_1358903 [Cyathus striatus]|nr:hypothetical protein BDQ17DRAFT_1358903 [Cyathus striatus]
MPPSPSHRPSQSASWNTQDSPTGSSQQRRMTTSSLNPPEGSQQQTFMRPPSPLRNTFIPDSSTGIDPDDDEHEDWNQRSPSPSSSVSQLAANLAQPPKSPSAMPTDAELEAEAERERDRSRREAEAILTREAQQRKLVEERVLAMMESTKSLPPPPSRSQTTSTPPSPSNSEKDRTRWWTAAKQRLTPTKDKEPLTPAQQIIQEAKAREKESKKNVKGKEREKSAEWPANPQSKYSDPAFSSLTLPPPPPPQRRPVPTSPSSPTPSRSNMAPVLTPSPMRSSEAASSPGREGPPIYAQFNGQGALDVPGTLLTIAKRFEKLEKWTVGHVRALEDRMNDVERWLVDKEKKDAQAEESRSVKSRQQESSGEMRGELNDIRDEVTELQGRVGELGREMAKMATSQNNLSSGPKTRTATVSQAPPTTSSIIEHAVTTSPPGSSLLGTPRMSSTARESTSPPIASSNARTTSGTRLPYPTGDYASPPDTFSPPASPPSSLNSSKRARPMSIAGLPGTASLSTPTSSYSSGLVSSPSSMSSGILRATSPTGYNSNAQRASTAPRQQSVSPTPRKRYTVALGGPIVAPPELSDDEKPNAPPQRRSRTPISFSRPQSSIGVALSTSPGTISGNDDNDIFNDFEDETIGKSAAARLSKKSDNGKEKEKEYKPSPSPTPGPPGLRGRPRPQSTYGYSNVPPPQTPVTPLRPRLRSKSSAGSDVSSLASATSGKFIDPLVLRKQEKGKESGTKLAMPKPSGKVPIGQLVAFFDGEKK